MDNLLNNALTAMADAAEASYGKEVGDQYRKAMDGQMCRTCRGKGQYAGLDITCRACNGSGIEPAGEICRHNLRVATCTACAYDRHRPEFSIAQLAAIRSAITDTIRSLPWDFSDVSEADMRTLCDLVQGRLLGQAVTVPAHDPDHLNPAEGGNRAADDYWEER